MNKAKRHLYIEVSKGVWFTTYGLKTESAWQYKAMRKERHRISAEQANGIIDRALALITDDKVQDELFVMECDAEPDTITIVDTDGKYFSKRFYNWSAPVSQELYAEIRTVLKIDMLLEFDYQFQTE